MPETVNNGIKNFKEHLLEEIVFGTLFKAHKYQLDLQLSCLHFKQMVLQLLVVTTSMNKQNGSYHFKVN